MKEINLASFDYRKLIPRGGVIPLSEKTGISINTFYGWQKRGNVPNFGNFVAAANGLGYEVIMRKKEE
jgi:hypothetical protein